ncbi:hypothetical protein OROMI_011448 [Orobanche minor]
MGEEKKEEAEKKEEEKKVEEAEKKAEEEKKEQEIVLKVDMHCEACARKVACSLKSLQGVESVTTDCKGSKVVVKGKDADPEKVCDRIQKKTGRKVELISPLPPKPSPEEEAAKPPPPPPEPKKEESAAITVVLKVHMHCEACAQALQKQIKKLKGVESVTTDLGKNEVVVKGIVDPDKLAADVYKKTGKQAEEVKEEEDKKPAEEKKEESVAEEDKKESSSVEEDVHKLTAAELRMMKKSEQWPAQRYYMEYAHQHYPPPQIFSDENPHACNIM